MEHCKLYRGYGAKFNGNNGVDRKIAARGVNPTETQPTYSQIRSLKVELTRAIGGVENHEFYFGNLEGRERDFGPFERFVQEFQATAAAARSWAWPARDYDFEQLMIYIGNEQNTFPVRNAAPILACDMFEHAYLIDFGTDRGAYLDTFFKNLDWDGVTANFDVVRKSCPTSVTFWC